MIISAPISAASLTTPEVIVRHSSTVFTGKSIVPYNNPTLSQLAARRFGYQESSDSQMEPTVAMVRKSPFVFITLYDG